MDISELSLEEKQACIIYMIDAISNHKLNYICHAFTDFIDEKTDVETVINADIDAEESFYGEDIMHIIFPELFNELKSLVDNEGDMKYNANNSRVLHYGCGNFTEKNKSTIWRYLEVDERVHFLNDLNETLK